MNEPQENGNGNRRQVALAPTRLPYHPALQERFGIGLAEWRALVDAIFPLAKDSESIILALSYCRARKLDPFKRVVHIVPMWNAALGRMVETVWPGIGELRTTAFRTRQYAGRDNAEFGPTLTRQVGTSTIEFPEWCQVTAYRILQGERYPFPGPRVYWMECYATTKKDDPTPNSMWRKRPFGQLDKCAEAAALRAAFPEEIGNDLTADEMEGKTIGVETSRLSGITPKRTLDDKLDVIAAGGEPEPPYDPPHDPETGEITETEQVMKEELASALAHGEEAARQLSAKLEDRARGHGGKEDDGQWILDPITQKLLDEGRAAATNGTAKYRKWENNVPIPSFALIKPHLKALRDAAANADGGGA